jgi:hypothetical protein
MEKKITDTVNVWNLYKKAHCSQKFRFSKNGLIFGWTHKTTFCMKDETFLYYQDSRDNKPLTGSNAPTIYVLYARAYFFHRQIDFALKRGKNIKNIKIFSTKQRSKDKFQKMT